jgi:hypothetical protein
MSYQAGPLGGRTKGSANMANPTGSTTAQSGPEDERVPIMQQILDNPFLLLFIGVTVPTVFYILWGVMEIVTIPISK